MQHHQLVSQGLDDIIDGNESYAQRYMQGLYFANDIVSFNDVNGMEGLFQAIWEKIKQFCAWIAGLFSSKKEVGIETKEVGIKPSLPKADKKTIKVTSVPAKKIKAEKPAPKAHVPTEEQKKADRVTMDITSEAELDMLMTGKTKTDKPAAKEEKKEVTLVLKTQNLEALYKTLRSISNKFANDAALVHESYKTAVKMFGDLKGVPDAVLNAFRPSPVEEFERRWKRPLELFKKFETLPNNYDTLSISQINHIADADITEICRVVGSAIESAKLTTMDRGWKTHSKEEILKYFEDIMKGVHEENDKAALGKVLIRLVRLDYDAWALYDHTDALSKLKQRIVDGEFFVRAPNV